MPTATWGGFVRVPAAAFFGLLLIGAAPVAAQGHEHGAAGPILLAHDGPADGRQFVGNLAHFAAIARGDDAVPDFHQDLPMRVTLNGQVLFETTASSGHDYDGVNVLDIVFPEPGPYVVEALDGSGNAVATFRGDVLPAPTARVRLSTVEDLEVLAGVATTYQFSLRDDADALVAHSDCWIEVLQGGATLLRTKTHTHEDQQAVTLVFPTAGTYVLRFTCFQAFPSAKATLFQPIVVERSVGVGVGPPLPVPASLPPLGAPPAALNAVVQGAAGGELLLVGTFDPGTIVGPNTLQHLAVLAVDPQTGVPRQHVDFTAVLRAPGGGVLFASDTLHEYDGIFEFTTRQAVPGIYTLDVTASTGDWSDSVALTYLVAPPALPTSAGPVGYHFGTFSADGQASDYVLGALAVTGPFAHSEVELRVQGEDGVPRLLTKLHTHDDGAFPFTLALATGQYEFRFDGFPLMPEAVLVAPATFDVDVPNGQVLEVSAVPQGQQETSATAFPVVVLALALLIFRRRY